MTSPVALREGVDAAGRTGRASGMKRLLTLFALSGAAGLIYEVVWFQLLRLTIGSSSQSLGILVACFMGGLCIGGLGFARAIPRRWATLRVYALFELGIAASGLAMPYLVRAVGLSYIAHAGSPATALLLRCAISAALLLPPTILMGATLPALARWIRADALQSQRIGLLYGVNTIGAVAGTFAASLALLPKLGIDGANLVAVGLNVLVALVALSLRSDADAAPEPSPAGNGDRTGSFAVYLAYALSGAAALSFEVLWARLLAMAFGATVYAFGLVLGTFLFGLGLGGVAGAIVGPRLRRPREAFAGVQVCVAAVVALTAIWARFTPFWFAEFDGSHAGHPVLLTLTNLLRAFVMVFPGAFLWGMSFPIALVNLGVRFSDAAAPVGRLYAFNTIGAVVGSLATSFLLIPLYGSAAGTAHLILLPLAAAIFLMVPLSAPRLVLTMAVLLVGVVVFATPAPMMANEALRSLVERLDDAPDLLFIIGVPVILGLLVAVIRWGRHGWAYALGLVAVGVALATAVPVELYMLGRQYASWTSARESSSVLLFEEGAMEPVVVALDPTGRMSISINSKVCASTVPEDMAVQRLLGHLPVLLAQDPTETLVIGLGAGVTAGAASLHDEVKRLDVVELEPQVLPAARAFSRYNDAVLDNPKTRIIVDDGRHWIATTDQHYGVITSDPIAPFLAGSAMLYTVEFYESCRARLRAGGVFCQWMGMNGMDEMGVRSLLGAFAEVFPEGTIWITPFDVVMMGGIGPVPFDVPMVREYLIANPRVATSLSEVGFDSAEDIAGCFLCSCRSLKDFLRGAQVNRDRNLNIQYRGWQAYYQHNLPEMRRLLVGLRSYDATVFVVPDEERVKFREALERRWSAYESDLEAMEKRYRGARGGA